MTRAFSAIDPVLVAAAAAAVVTGLLTPIARHVALRRGYLDVPSDRSSHDRPTPRTGGYAILMGAAVGVWIGDGWRAGYVVVLLIGAVLLAALAMLDERRELRRFIRLCAQVTIGAFIVWGLGGTSAPAGSYLEAGYPVVALLGVVWLVAVVNTYNFMDGLNGMIAIAATITGVVLAVMAVRRGDAAAAVVASSMAGAAAGFLPFNLSGSIFMGDTGSTLFGLMFGALILRGDPTPLAAALPMAPFLLDAGSTVARRALRGERFFSTPHRSHAYQRLQQTGWSHGAVAWLYGALTMASGAFALVFNSLSRDASVAVLAVIVVGHAMIFAHIHERWSRQFGRRPPGGVRSEQ